MQDKVKRVAFKSFKNIMIGYILWPVGADILWPVNQSIIKRLLLNCCFVEHQGSYL